MSRIITALLLIPTAALAQQRARALGITPGALPPGPRNAITDVSGVRVGHATLRLGDSVRTGVTAILPHAGNLYLDRVPAAIHVGNGFGKLAGSTQVNELGELESPILLTGTLCVWKAADALVARMLEQPGMDAVRSINPVVGETNDGFLSAIRSRPVGADQVRAALAGADTGVVAEGSVGAGTGTVAFGWKGGFGTASRVAGSGPWTVGVLVQANFGGDLLVMGVPVGRQLGRTGTGRAAALRQDDDDGSGPHRLVSRERLRRLCHRLFHPPLGAARFPGPGADPARARERGNKRALSGRGRSHRGSDLQRALHGDHGGRERQSCRGDSARGRQANPRETSEVKIPEPTA